MKSGDMIIKTKGRGAWFVLTPLIGENVLVKEVRSGNEKVLSLTQIQDPKSHLKILRRS